MAACDMNDQISFVNKWACAFLINNDPVGFFDIFSVSIPLLVFVWLFDRYRVTTAIGSELEF